MLKALWTSCYVEKYDKYFNDLFEVEKALPCIDNKNCMKLEGDAVLEAVKDKDVLILGYEDITKEVIEKSPNLKIILSERDGPEENVDIEACTEAGIPVISAAGRCAQSVAEHCMAQMMALSRRIVPFNNHFKKEGWEYLFKNRDEVQAICELYTKTLGLVGFGRNARALATIAHGFNMDIIVYDPYVSEEQAKEAGVRKGTLDEVMAQGDYIVLLARVTPETKGMVSAEKIALMKPSAFFINSGRSALTDEKAVIEALKAGKIKGVALDVFDDEPFTLNISNMPLGCDMDDKNIIITPHIAGNSDMRVIHQYNNMIDGLESFLKGEKTIRLYNPKVFDSPNFPERGGKIFGMKK